MKTRPNILWLCADQMRYDMIHALGNRYIDTPNFDSLCRDGVAFDKAYVQNPVCTPSRASFMTGKYPSAINSNILGGKNNPEHCTLITKALADAGYYCGNIGKLHISAAWEGHENRTDDGYKTFIYSLSPGHDLESGCNEYKDWLEQKGVNWRDIMVGDGKRNYYWYREDAPVELRQTAWAAEMAIDFINEHSSDDEPWLLTVNCFDPHPPYDAPTHLVEKYLARNIPDPIFNESDYTLGEQLKKIYHQSKGVNAPNDTLRRERASYFGMCEIVDMHFGRIIDRIDKLGLRDDTVIIISSDHGEMLGDHGLTHKGCRFYEGAVRVPLIFSCPARMKSGKVVRGITEYTDIAPTIAELCGVEFGDVHGHSLVRALTEEGEGIERDYVRCEYYQSCRGGKNPTQSYATMLRDKRYKLVVYHGVETGELYDLDTDPCEQHNLWFDEHYSELRFELLKKSFDISAVVQRPGQVRIGRY
ncbi:MAG: sulfatase-like hydrolase/transferase [Clostridia bacterium]|nr:sulfatase-like hydrolase/transferase [Clostridia bacterium]